MKVEVELSWKNETKVLEGEFKTIKDVLNQLNIFPSEVVIIKNGKIVLEEEKVSDGDKIKLINVISGGWNADFVEIGLLFGQLKANYAKITLKNI